MPHQNVTSLWRRRTGTKLSQQTRRELLEELRERYRNASKIDKTKILDEFIDIAGCHCKDAIRLLTEVDPVRPEAPRLGRTIYSEAVRQSLVVLWEAADRICGKRLKAILPGLISAPDRYEPDRSPGRPSPRVDSGPCTLVDSSSRTAQDGPFTVSEGG